eukprot:1483800-Rhodomonas_salina.1
MGGPAPAAAPPGVGSFAGGGGSTEKRKRGRPKGSKNKRNRDVSNLAEEAADDDGEMVHEGMEGAGDEQKKSRQETVELLFAELNQNVIRAQVGHTEDGFTCFLNEDVVPESYRDNCFRPILPNEEGYCSPLDTHMRSMNSVSRSWRTVRETWVNETLPCTRNTGPCLSICRKNHTPNMPEDFKELAYLVCAVNSMPTFDGCIVPTPDTRLKWSSDFQHIVGVQYRQPNVEERHRQQQAVDRGASEKRVFMGATVPDADSMTYGRDDSLDGEAFVSCDPVTLVVSIVPVHYTYEGEQCKQTFWVATVIPQPGVDVVRCFERLGKPLSVNSLMDIRLANERRNRWAHLNYVEPFHSYNLQVQEWDYLFTPGTSDNYTDRRHPYLSMNSTSVIHKIIQSLPNGVEDCYMVGLPPVVDTEDLHKLYENHLANWHMCIEWATEFSKLSQAIASCRGGDRRYIPPLNLPVVPGYVFRKRGSGPCFYSLLGEPPLNFLWKPMLDIDSRIAFEEFFIGKLPILVQGTLMAWIFDGDINEFLGTESDVLTEDKIFDRYYRNKNSALDDCMRSGCLSHWRESVMQNIAKILQRYMLQVEFQEDLEILQALGEMEDFNQDDAYQRDVGRIKDRAQSRPEKADAARAGVTEEGGQDVSEKDGSRSGESGTDESEEDESGEDEEEDEEEERAPQSKYIDSDALCDSGDDHDIGH